MHPVFRERLSVCRLTLGDLVLMVREDQVLAARMDIDLITEVSLCHNRALDMPARTAFAPRGLPVRLTFFFRLPENKVVRVLFSFLTGYLNLTETGLKIIQVLVGQLSVIFKLADTVINCSVRSNIRVAFLDQSADHV